MIGLTPASQVGTFSDITPENCPIIDKRVDTTLLSQFGFDEGIE
jgi:hypothetical protein